MKKNIIIKKIIFNLVEIYCIFVAGYFVIGLHNSIFIIALFVIFKGLICKFFKGESLHYKQFYKCSIISFSILMTLFYVCKFNVFQSCFLTFLSSYLMTTCANVNVKEVIINIDDNLFHWKKGSKYQPLIEFMQYDYDDPRLLKYENYLKNTDTLKYNLYTLKFKDKKSMEQINEITEIYDNKKIINNLDQIYDTLKYTLCLET